MICPFKFSHYEFEGGQDCIGTECGMHKLCNADYEITEVEFDALDEHAQALERENAELRKLCGANDTLAAENDVSAASVDANDGSELQARVDELTSELTAARNAHAQAEHEAVILREKLGRMLDNAHEITRIGGDC